MKRRGSMSAPSCRSRRGSGPAAAIGWPSGFSTSTMVSDPPVHLRSADGAAPRTGQRARRRRGDRCQSGARALVESRYAESIRLYREALAVQRSALGPTHAGTLESIYWLANALHSSGDANAAVPLFDEWLRAARAIPAQRRVARADQLVRLGQTAPDPRRCRRRGACVRGGGVGTPGDVRRPSPECRVRLHRLGTVQRTGGRLEESARPNPRAAPRRPR